MELYCKTELEANMDSRIERQRAIVAEHIRCENEHDWPAVYNTFVQDDRAFYDVIPLKASFKGIEGVRQFYSTIAAAVPDLHIEVTAQYDTPGCTICETTISGTHLGPYLHMAASGNSIRFELAAFYLFDEDCTKLIAERIYYDQASAIAQMQPSQIAQSA
jgi:steroid delta-isomerase-like uncharacterized protein